MKKTIFLLSVSLLFLFSNSVIAEKQRMYFVNTIFDRGNVTIGDISTGEGYIPGENFSEDGFTYELELISFAGAILETRKFTFNLEVLYSPPEGEWENSTSGPTRLNYTEQTEVLPYHEDGKTINIYDANHSLVDSKEVGYLANICGDGVCQDHESYESCQKDCPAAGKDDYCNMEKINEDPDCISILEAQKLATQTKAGEGISGFLKNKKLLFIAAGIFLFIILLIIAIVYYIRRRRKEDNNENVVRYSQPKDVK